VSDVDLRRNVIIPNNPDGMRFEGEWIAVPREDFVGVRDELARLRAALKRPASWDEMAGNGDPDEFPTFYRQEIAARINTALAALHPKGE